VGSGARPVVLLKTIRKREGKLFAAIEASGGAACGMESRPDCGGNDESARIERVSDAERDGAECGSESADHGGGLCGVFLTHVAWPKGSNEEIELPTIRGDDETAGEDQSGNWLGASAGGFRTTKARGHLWQWGDKRGVEEFCDGAPGERVSNCGVHEWRYWDAPWAERVIRAATGRDSGGVFVGVGRPKIFGGARKKADSRWQKIAPRMTTSCEWQGRRSSA